MRRIALATFVVCMAAGAALGGVTEQTSYRPFIVHGKTARSIYNSVLAHSRKKDGFSTFATTDVSLKPRVRLVSHPQCKITAALISARFVVRLPQLASEAGLSPALRADWKSFVAELKKHEEHHRDIWLGCARDLADAATSVPAGDCKSFARKFASRIKTQNAHCRARNQAFDAEAQGRLPAFPFIQRALLNR